MSGGALKLMCDELRVKLLKDEKKLSELKGHRKGLQLLKFLITQTRYNTCMWRRNLGKYVPHTAKPLDLPKQEFWWSDSAKADNVFAHNMKEIDDVEMQILRSPKMSPDEVLVEANRIKRLQKNFGGLWIHFRNTPSHEQPDMTALRTPHYWQD